MFIPLHDANALKYIKVQYVTIGLIVVNVAVWLVTGLASTQEFSDAAVVGLGYIPAVVFDFADLQQDLVLVPEDMTFITYAFLHIDFLHLASNMLFLWVFADNLEARLGPAPFALFLAGFRISARTVWSSGCSATMSRMRWGTSASSSSISCVRRPGRWCMASCSRPRRRR